MNTIHEPSDAIGYGYGGWVTDWSDFELRLLIDFDPFVIEIGRKKRKATIRPAFSWKRARQPTKRGARSSIGLKPEAREWQAAAARQLRAQWGGWEPIPREVMINAAIVSYLHDARLPDASNLYQGPEDCMSSCRTGKRPCPPGCQAHAAIYVDDVQIQTHDGSDRLIDRLHPRVEITLTPYRPGGR